MLDVADTSTNPSVEMGAHLSNIAEEGKPSSGTPLSRSSSRKSTMRYSISTMTWE